MSEARTGQWPQSEFVAPQESVGPKGPGAPEESVGAPVDPRAAKAVAALVAADMSIATAESLTGGLVCAALTSVPGASAVVFGGVASYATDLKIRVLGVPAEVIAEHGTVAEVTARLMADGVRDLTGANLGVATTGVAGPDAIEGHPVGTVFVAITWRDEAGESAGRVLALKGHGSREQIRRRSVEAALDLVAEVLTEAEQDS